MGREVDEGFGFGVGCWCCACARSGTLEVGGGGAFVGVAVWVAFGDVAAEVGGLVRGGLSAGSIQGAAGEWVFAVAVIEQVWTTREWLLFSGFALRDVALSLTVGAPEQACGCEILLRLVD